MKIQCRNKDCARIIEVEEGDWNPIEDTCSICGSRFKKYEGSKRAEKSYSEDADTEKSDENSEGEEENEDESEENSFTCCSCDKDFPEDDLICLNEDDEIYVCKKCIDKKYPREQKTVIKEIPKFIERKKDKKESSFDFSGPNKFD